MMARLHRLLIVVALVAACSDEATVLAPRDRGVSADLPAVDATGTKEDAADGAPVDEGGDGPSGDEGVAPDEGDGRADIGDDVAPTDTGDDTPDTPALPCGGCDDGNPCTAEACDTTTDTCVTQLLTGPCDDGDPCTLSDECALGTCVSGRRDRCDDGDPCTVDACDREAGCGHTPAAEGASCGDGMVCDADGACVEFVCEPACDGKMCGPDGCGDTCGDCADGEACDPAGQCVPDHCEPVCDGRICGPDHCGGTCGSCDDGDPCTLDICEAGTSCTRAPSTAPCDDGDACSRLDQCADFACVGGDRLDCDDDDACTADGCTADGDCTHEAIGADCVDDDVCTDDRCEPATGCTFPHNTAACDDGDECTVGDACAAGTCAGAVSDHCDDGDPCTADQCDPANGNCSRTQRPHGYDCDEGRICSEGGACVVPPRIERYEPIPAPVGAFVTLHGVGFVAPDGVAAPSTVTLGGVAAPVVEASAERLVAVVAPGARSGDAVVTVPTVGASEALPFTVAPAPAPTFRATPVGDADGPFEAAWMSDVQISTGGDWAFGKFTFEAAEGGARMAFLNLANGALFAAGGSDTVTTISGSAAIAPAGGTGYWIVHGDPPLLYAADRQQQGAPLYQASENWRLVAGPIAASQVGPPPVRIYATVRFGQPGSQKLAVAQLPDGGQPVFDLLTEAELAAVSGAVGSVQILGLHAAATASRIAVVVGSTCSGGCQLSYQVAAGDGGDHREVLASDVAASHSVLRLSGDGRWLAVVYDTLAGAEVARLIDLDGDEIVDFSFGEGWSHRAVGLSRDAATVVVQRQGPAGGGWHAWDRAADTWLDLSVLGVWGTQPAPPAVVVGGSGRRAYFPAPLPSLRAALWRVDLDPAAPADAPPAEPGLYRCSLRPEALDTGAADVAVAVKEPAVGAPLGAASLTTTAGPLGVEAARLDTRGCALVDDGASDDLTAGDGLRHCVGVGVLADPGAGPLTLRCAVRDAAGGVIVVDRPLP